MTLNTKLFSKPKNVCESLWLKRSYDLYSSFILFLVSLFFLLACFLCSVCLQSRSVPCPKSSASHLASFASAKTAAFSPETLLWNQIYETFPSMYSKQFGFLLD
jgi:hypothetical protein